MFSDFIVDRSAQSHKPFNSIVSKNPQVPLGLRNTAVFVLKPRLLLTPTLMPSVDRLDSSSIPLRQTE